MIFGFFNDLIRKVGVPALEDQECRNKAAAVLRAVAMASSMRVVTSDLPDATRE